ncbi:hypothetical protein BDN72DRAFT_850437 [Pluteus cervinus]|uniref:Uncharacterized protein n=1 Tax=Pluteus cervinus TaxID=181527 RepID=A0ACD3A4H3_9AGAR|nr:hypothetical protein BDN72DRAFT_850437 [Pluteus cervinus]
MDKFSDRRSQLDVEICDLEARLLSLRKARNDIAPINQLPIELLIKIFGSLGGIKGRAKEILRLTWVSHYWREIATTCPGLWAILDNSNVKEGCIDTWLMRSKTSPLSVRILNLLERHHRYLQVVLSPPIHITSLRLSRHHSTPDNLERIWTMTNLPSIRLLFLKGFKIPNLVVTSTPNLHVLLLEQCDLDIASALTAYSSAPLRELSIISPIQLIDPSTLLERLGDISNLNTLILIGAVSEQLHPNTQDVSIPNLHLDRLVLRYGPTEAQKWLLQRLIRTGTKRVASCSFLPSTQERPHTEDLVSTFRQIPSTGARFITRIDILEFPGSGYRACIFYEESGGGRIELTLELFFAYSLLRLLHNLNADSSLDNLKVFRILRMGDIPSGPLESGLPHSIARFITNLPHVKHVHLQTPFPFVKIFLSSCTDKVRSAALHDDINVLETVTIEANHPPEVNFTIDTTDYLVKPIKNIILNQDCFIEDYSSFANMVVVAGTESHIRLVPELDMTPIRFPKHPLESFDDLDTDG